MTRGQRALAAVGSWTAVGLFLIARGSILAGLLILLVGSSVTVVVLRVTHPKGAARPTLAGLGLLGAPPRSAVPATEEQLAAQRAELERRRIESERRAIERTERRRQVEALRDERRREREEAARRAAEARERERAEAARRAAEARERERAEAARRAAEARERAEAERGQLEAGIASAEPATDEDILAASQRAALDEDDLDEVQRQRIYLLNKVRLKLSDYE
jgi:flagellar biosynthesis GTPase FlhF